MKAYQVILVTGIATLAAGCMALSESTPISSQSPATADMKAQIIASAPDVRRDPASIRNAEISSVVPNPNGNGLLVCVRAKTRDGAGGYTGRRIRLVPFTIDRTVVPRGGIESSPFCANPALKWQAFPEIHAFYRSQ